MYNIIYLLYTRIPTYNIIIWVLRRGPEHSRMIYLPIPMYRHIIYHTYNADALYTGTTGPGVGQLAGAQ